MSGGGGNLSSWAIERPLPAMMLFFVLCVAGLWGFHVLPVARFPDIAFPMTTVTVSLPGASPSQLETEVTRRIEDSVATVPDLKRMTSAVSEGVSTTFLEFNLDADLSTALDDTRDAVTRIRSDLPQDILEPVVGKVDIGGSLQTYAVSAARMSPDELSWFVDRDVARALYGVKGVAKVTRIGGVERQVRVDLDPDALLAWGITAGDVSQQLARIQVERPGGKTEIGGEQQTIRTIGTVNSAQQLRDFSISLADGRSVRLSTIAHVHDAAADESQAALLDGKPAVGFSLSRTRKSDELRVSADVRDALAKLEAAHPGIAFRLVTNTVGRNRTFLSLIDDDAVGRRAARAGGGVVVPARLARDLGVGGGVAAVDHSDVRGDFVARFQPQHHHLAGAVGGRGHPGGRCDRRDRKHRAPSGHGQDTANRPRTMPPRKSARQ